MLRRETVPCHLRDEEHARVDHVIRDREVLADTLHLQVHERIEVDVDTVENTRLQRMVGLAERNGCRRGADRLIPRQRGLKIGYANLLVVQILERTERRVAHENVPVAAEGVRQTHHAEALHAREHFLGRRCLGRAYG